MKEIRYRVWWALCTLEHKLAVMTGRPTYFPEANCSVPLPLPVEEDDIESRASSRPESAQNASGRSTPSSAQSSRISQSPAHTQSSASQQQRTASHSSSSKPNTGLYFHHLVKLSILTNEILRRLYSAEGISRPWAQMQSIIADLNGRLTHWQEDLPEGLDFTRAVDDVRWIHFRRLLAFFFYSTRIIVNRPCLCRIDQKIQKQSSFSREFDQSTAAECVRAACHMLDLLAEQINPTSLYAHSPWWCLVHYLVEAAVVCMLELSFRSNHMPNEIEDVFRRSNKAVQWLQSMADNDTAADRAARMCSDLLRRTAPKAGKSTAASFPSREQSGSGSSLQSPLRRSSPGQSAYEQKVSTPFEPHIFATYDQWPQGQFRPPDDRALSVNPDTDSLRVYMPPTAEMDQMEFETMVNDQGYFPTPQNPQNPHWYGDDEGQL